MVTWVLGTVISTRSSSGWRDGSWEDAGSLPLSSTWLFSSTWLLSPVETGSLWEAASEEGTSEGASSPPQAARLRESITATRQAVHLVIRFMADSPLG